VLVDKVRYESFAKSIIFVPLAISMVAAAVIWKFMYAYAPPGTPQTGTVNGVLNGVGLPLIAFPTNETLSMNTIMIILIMTWMWTGFAMVIISAALKGINVELLEAARVDGATEWQVFRGIVFPLLVPTLAGGLDDYRDHRAQGVRHRLHPDQRRLQHRCHRQHDVQRDVQQCQLRTSLGACRWCCWWRSCR